MVAGVPYQGGATWVVLQYLLGFRRLGHEVYLVEPVNHAALQPTGAALDSSINARYFQEVMADFGLRESATLLLRDTTQTVGLPYPRLREVARRADVLINVAGMLRDPALVERIATRVYLDLDPAFVQLWQAVEGIDMHFDGHTHFVTVGMAIGQPGCDVPMCGHAWIRTLQPVVLERWPVATRVTRDALTTVGNWRGYGSIEHDGALYGQKVHSLRPLITLPRQTAEKFVLALAIHPGEERDLCALATHGWEVVDPARVARTPDRYQRFIQGSKAELGLVKSGYVLSRCGWFSERSVCYLASGRPVIAQDTGFSRFLPTGAGLFAFDTRDDILSSIEKLNRDYVSQARAAREIAEQHFDSDRVLTALLDRLGARI
ncbi:MAG: hypothetical protein DLM70_11885 [Chloroflexi bacterium]|nr:MAG: hypothetical protein DLM70_11885 [Chloroflexota bacterium]